jgi:hypothetical protein
MENINIIATLFGTLITLLLSIVAYFIKQLHTDFKSMEKDLIIKIQIMKNNKMNLVERTLAPTPKWFKILRTVGIALASVGGIIIASPIALPVGLVSAAGYLVLGGSIISVVSQTAVKSEEEPKTNP